MSKPPVVVINKYIQDSLRWDKNVYKVALRRDAPRRQQRGRRRPAHVHDREERTRRRRASRSCNCRICNELGEGARRESEQRRAAEVPVPRERGRAADAAEGRPARRLRASPARARRASHRPDGDRPGRDEALLHVPDPPVDAGGGRRHLSTLRRRREMRGRGASGCVLALGGASVSHRGDRSARDAARQTLDYWVAAVPVAWNMVPNGRDAIMGMDDPAVEDSVFQTVVYRRYTRGLAQAAGQRAARRAPTGCSSRGRCSRRASATGSAIHFKNMDTLRHEPHSMHFHGVHYAAELRRRLRPGFSGRGRERASPASRTPTC